MPNQQRYPVYTWSATQQWPQQLYYAPSYWGYPQVPYPYGPYAGVTPAGSYAQLGYPSPGRKERRRSTTPPPDVQTHLLLGGQYKPTCVWDVSRDPMTARHITSRGTIEPIPAEELDSPATSPGAHFMKIVCDLFPWEIKLHVPRNEEVPVMLVLSSIFGTLQESLDVIEWEESTSNNRRRAHKAMCTRLSHGPPEYEVKGHVKRIDTLDKTYFVGLKPVGPAYAPEEWLLKLGSPPKEPRR